LYIPPSVYTEKEPQDSKLCEKWSLFTFNIVVIRYGTSLFPWTFTNLFTASN
jgi:hypothetical protein